MKRVWGQISVGAAALAAAGVAAPACTHNDSEVFIRDVLHQPSVTAGQVCEFTSDPTQPFITSGVLDTSIASSYFAWLLVGNQTVAQANQANLQTETSIVHIEYAVVRVTDTTGAQLSTYTYSVSATIDPAVGSVPSYAPMEVMLVDNVSAFSPEVTKAILVSRDIATPLSFRVLTYTRLYGHTLGHEAVESNEFSFPVDVCYGCLIASSSGAVSSSSSVPCTAGQDDHIFCSSCPSASGGCNLICSAAASDAGISQAQDGGTATDATTD